MSHFNVLVVGDVDYNMAPFHEFECDGIDDEFVQTIDVTDDYKKEFEEAKAQYAKEVAEGADEKATRYSFKGKTFREFIEKYNGIHFAESVDKLDLTSHEKHKFRYFLPVEGAEDDFRVFKRTNPNKFYDYYGKGWKGLLLKEKGENGKDQYVNEAYKRDVDFERMWKKREEEVRANYRKVIQAIGFVPKLNRPWESLIPLFAPDDGSEPQMTKKEASTIYERQKAVKAFGKALKDGLISYDDVGIFGLVDEYAMSEDEFVESKHIHALVFGWVKDREYHSEGDMGWWAFVSNEKEPKSWDKEYMDFINSLDDDDFLTIVNCHI